MKKLLSSGLAIGAMISFVGCGGGSSSSTPLEVTGQFVDGYVSGLNYTCDPSDKSGITNDIGEYTCNEGDTVTFSLGAYVLGTATASSGIVTPYDIQSDNETSAINVARLLQTLDTDDSDDIITIPADFTALDNSTVELNATFSDFEAGMLEDLTSIGITDLIGAEAAQNTMDGDILTALLAGKTFYNVGSDNTGDNWIDSIVFNADATSLEWSSLTDTESGTLTVEIDGNSIILSGIDGTFELVFVEETADKLVFHGLDSSGITVEEDFMFFDQAAAQAYYDSLQPEPEEPATTLTELLAGKTFYNVGSDNTGDNWIDSVVFNSDATSLTWASLTNSETGSHTVVIEGNTITLNGDEGDFTLTFVEEDNEKLVFHRIEGGVTVEEDFMFFDQATAQAYYDSLTTVTTPEPTPDPTLADLLAGKTVYGENNYDAWTFNETLTQVSIIDVDALPGSTPEVIDISVEGNIITADGGATTIEALYQQTDIKLTWLTGPDAGMVDNIWFDLATLESILGM